MKKTVTLLFAILLSNILLFGCGNNVNDELEALRAEIERLKSTTNPTDITTEPLIEIESTESVSVTTEPTTAQETDPTTIQESITTTEKPTETPTKEITTEETTSEFYFINVEITNKYNLPKNYDARRYSDRVEFDIKVTNYGTKSIRGIQGVLDIQDMFGKSIKSLNCDLTQQTIGANQYHTYKGLGWDINQFKNEDTKIYNSDYDTLIFVYTVNQVIYSN